MGDCHFEWSVKSERLSQKIFYDYVAEFSSSVSKYNRREEEYVPCLLLLLEEDLETALIGRNLAYVYVEKTK